MRKYRLRIGLDVDDTLYECNSYALRLLKERYGEVPSLDINHIQTWGRLNDLSDERLAYFGDPDFVRTQPLYPGAQKLVADLVEFAEVFFITAVPPACMSARAQKLIEDFPEVPASNILIGTRKDIVHLDILLDDAAHNIASSQAAYPVLLRRPWNNDLSGLLAVNGYDDFVHLAKSVANSFVDKPADLTKGGCVCLVGSSGTGKTEIVKGLTADPRFFKPKTTTTRDKLPHEDDTAYRFVDKQTFLYQKEHGGFIETTVYGNHFYGTQAEEFEPIAQGKIAVLPIDVCGALSIRNRYRGKTLLVFCDKGKKEIIANILSRPIPDEDKINRLMALDFEARNQELCDVAVSIDEGVAACVATILNKIG